MHEVQLLIRTWNKRLSREILALWLDLLNSEGWIAREQVIPTIAHLDSCLEIYSRISEAVGNCKACRCLEKSIELTATTKRSMPFVVTNS